MEKKVRALQTNAAVMWNGWIWIFDRNINALFRREMASGRIEYVLSVRDEEAYQKSLFSNIFFYKNRLFLVAYCAKKNVLINLEDMSQKKIDCKRLDNQYNIRTASSVQCGSKVYMLPKFWGDNIVVWDFEDELLREIRLDYGLLSRYMRVPEDKNTWYAGMMINGEFWLVSLCSTKIVRVNMYGNLNIYPVNTVNAGFGRMNVWGDKIFLTPYEGTELIQFDIGTQRSKPVFQEGNLFSGHSLNPYGGMAIVGNMMVLLPHKEEQIVLLNLKTREIRKWDAGNTRFFAWVQEREWIYMLPYLGNEICILNVETGKIAKDQCCRPLTHKGKDFYQCWMEEISTMCGTEIIYSETVCSMEQFLEAAIPSDPDPGLQDRKSIGMVILEKIHNNVNHRR